MTVKEAIDNCVNEIESRSFSIAGGYLPHQIRLNAKIDGIRVDDIYYALQRLYGWRVNKGFIRGTMEM